MKQELTKEELYVLARRAKVDVEILLRFKNYLDTKKVRSELIRYEFKCLNKETEFNKGQVISSLMKKYGVSKSYIELIIYAKKSNKGRPCVRCGKLISTYKWGRNNGVCDNCINRAIKNYDLYENEQLIEDNEDDIALADEEPTWDQYPDTLP